MKYSTEELNLAAQVASLAQAKLDAHYSQIRLFLEQSTSVEHMQKIQNDFNEKRTLEFFIDEAVVDIHKAAHSLYGKRE